MKRNPAARNAFTRIILLAISSAAFAQSPNMQPPAAAATVPAAPLTLKFKLADVHPDPRIKATSMSGGYLDGERYIVRHVTLLTLVSNAYNVPFRKILGGPSWLDQNRYEIFAQAPSDTSDNDIQAMLRSLLADRFKLVVHTESRPLPAYLITAPEGASKMKRSDGSGTPGCKTQQQPDVTLPEGAPVLFSCHAESMSAFAKFLQSIMSSPTDDVDNTGLEGRWDFTFKFTYPSRTNRDLVNNLKALERWVGLKLEPSTSPQAVLIVDSVNETPTPNPPGIAEVLPPPATFDVATIKPSSPDTNDVAGHIGEGKIDLTGVTMKFLINLAFDLNDEAIANPPIWLDKNKFDIFAKVAQPDPATRPANAVPFNDEDLPPMLKKLLEDRFGLKWHMEDRPADAYVLLSIDPKMKTADPLFHSSCKEGPGHDGKDPRIANPVRGRLLSCQNITMKQFAHLLPSRSTGYIRIPIFDETGLNGAYDFVLSFSGYSQVGGINEWSLQPPPPGGPNAVHLVVPPGGLLLFDAIQQQLGLKLEKEKHPVPMLVIDHINEKPTEQ